MEDKEKMSVIGMVVGSKDDTDEMQMMEYLGIQVLLTTGPRFLSPVPTASV